MTIPIQLFASLKDAAKASQIEVEIPENCSVSQLLEIVARDFPALEKWLPHCRVAVNLDYTTNDQIVRDGDEVALIPPVSGGAQIENAPFVEVRAGELSLDEVVKAVGKQKGGAAGAICSFLGVVRETSKDLEGNSHDDIEFLDYEAYAPMAAREIEKIAREAMEKWDACVAVTHRVGRLGIGEASVAIAVATAHRGPSFEACRYVIEELKKRAPIWKRETARDGFWWVEGSVG
ncbi:molybdopterin synthase subunit MoaE /molybdopterin synthase subunit MoaD [Abditibacterium utsteinense]|uniref:Molybdopterin synthase catalytic subunit n=1 Tax=Abditibacterium utsteinense TaxID=1960156 RepID=A0A2S8SWG0_9BACT|nr:molybdenum cofactor biosynthesis protein MoaE [Abditibacterium utsteinense]PQV65146.1 molybdopterin synthase subunit MoaE /molybdopterin synthase subunit MoaD [Abditibacterium utsteinense]